MNRPRYTACFCRLYSFGVGVVVRSENPDIKAGAHVYGILGEIAVMSNYVVDESGINGCAPLDHQEYVVKSDVTGLQVLQNPYNLPWSAFIGVLGMPGQF